MLTVVEGGTEGWLGCIKFTPHIHILRALPGEEKSEAWAGWTRTTADHAGPRLALLDITKFCHQLRLVTGDKGQPLGKVIAPDRRGITEVTQIQIRISL